MYLNQLESHLAVFSINRNAIGCYDFVRIVMFEIFFLVFLNCRNILGEEGGQSFEMILAWLRLVVVLASQLVESSPTSSLLLFLPALHIVRFLKNCCRTVVRLLKDCWKTIEGLLASQFVESSLTSSLVLLLRHCTFYDFCLWKVNFEKLL